MTSELSVGTTFWQKVCLKPSCLDYGTVSLTNCVEESGACSHRQDNARPVAAGCRSLDYGVTNREIDVTPLHGAETEYCAVSPPPLFLCPDYGISFLDVTLSLNTGWWRKSIDRGRNSVFS